MDEIEVFRSAVDERRWYWRRVSANGQITEIGGESFTRRWSAKRAARKANRDPFWRWEK